MFSSRFINYSSLLAIYLGVIASTSHALNPRPRTGGISDDPVSVCLQDCKPSGGAQGTSGGDSNSPTWNCGSPGASPGAGDAWRGTFGEAVDSFLSSHGVEESELCQGKCDAGKTCKPNLDTLYIEGGGYAQHGCPSASDQNAVCCYMTADSPGAPTFKVEECKCE